MSFWKKYRRYLADNPRGYWFRRHVYGFGWTPARWQGFITLAVFVGILSWMLFTFIRVPQPSAADVELFAIEVVILVLLLIGICYWKGEPPRWQWGFPEDSDR